MPHRLILVPSFRVYGPPVLSLKKNRAYSSRPSSSELTPRPSLLLNSSQGIRRVGFHLERRGCSCWLPAESMPVVRKCGRGSRRLRLTAEHPSSSSASLIFRICVRGRSPLPKWRRPISDSVCGICRPEPSVSISFQKGQRTLRPARR